MNHKWMLIFELSFFSGGDDAMVLSRATAEYQKRRSWGFPGGAVVENLPANAGNTGLSPGLGRSHMPRSN